MSFMARTVTAANGSQTTFPVSFPLPPLTGRNGVVVYVHASGALDPGAPKVAGTDFNWVSDGQISFPVHPANGQVVDVRRATTDNALDNTIQAGGSLRSSELVQNDTQLLYITQELQDEDALRLTQLEAEANTRSAADTAETNARVLADNAEANARSNADAAEALARANAITAEATARLLGDANEITARNAAIANEVVNRNAAIEVESGNRATAVLNETSGRVAAGAALQASLNNEAILRSNGDAAILAALAPGSLNNATLNAADRGILAALDHTPGIPAWLNEGVRQGIYIPMNAADYLARTGRVLGTDKALDTYSGGNLFITSTRNANYTWVYPYWALDVSDRLFGATDGTDLKAAIEAWSTLCWQLPCKSCSQLASGTTAATITVGYSAITGSLTLDIRLGGTINATATMDTIIYLRNIFNCNVNYSGCHLWGAPGINGTPNAYSIRLAKNGITYAGSSHSRSTGVLAADAFIYWAVTNDWVGVKLNHYLELPQIRARSCGSSPRAGGIYELAANWTAFTSTQNGNVTSGNPVVPGLTDTTGMIPGQGVTGTGIQVNTGILTVDGPTQITLDKAPTAGTGAAVSLTVQSRKGSNNSTNQMTVLSLDVAPPADPQGLPQALKLGGYYYPVVSITGAGPYAVTLSYPWIANAILAGGLTGTCEWVFGGAIGFIGNSSGNVLAPSVSTQYAGFVTFDCTVYGMTVLRNNADGNTEFWLGIGPIAQAAKIGARYLGGYSENPPNILQVDNYISSAGVVLGTIRGHAYDPTIHYKMAPRATLTVDNQNGLALLGLHVDGSSGKTIVAQNAQPFTATWDPPSLAAGVGATTTFTIPYIADTSTPLRARFSNPLQGLTLTASILSSNAVTGLSTVTVTLFNGTGAGPVDLASGTVSVELLK